MPVTKSPAYRRKSVRNHVYAVVTLRDAESSKVQDFYLGDYDSAASREAFHRVVAEWEARGRKLPGDGQAIVTAPARGITVTQLVAAYWAHVEQAYCGGHRCAIRQAIAILRNLYGSEPAASIGPNRLRQARDAMVVGDAGGKDRKPRAPWSRRICNRGTKLIVQMYKWAVAHELLPASVYEALRTIEPLKRGRTIAHEPAPVRCAPTAHVHAALVKCPRMVRLMIRLQALTGMRPAEVCNLRLCDIDRTGDLWVYSPAEHKNAWRNRTRTIYFGPRARRLLAAVLHTWPTASYVFSPERAEAERLAERHARRVTPLSYGNRPGTNRVDHRKRPPGDHYDVAAYRRAITRACELAGVPNWSPNQLRHSFATRVRRDYGLEAAQILLGHSSALVTDAVYAERDEGRARAIAARIG